MVTDIISMSLYNDLAYV